GFQGERRILLRIVGELCPCVLVGALDGRAAGFQDDANAISVDKLAVSQVSQDLRDRPRLRGGALRQFFIRDTFDQPGNLPRSGGQDFHRLFSLEVAEDSLCVLLRRFLHDGSPSFQKVTAWDFTGKDLPAAAERGTAPALAPPCRSRGALSQSEEPRSRSCLFP